MTYITGNTGKWEYVIGLEVHAQVSSLSKLFSGASTKFGSMPNSQVSLIDAAMPGMLPVLNKVCVHQAIKTSLAINAKVNLTSVFDRKHYFYADLPSGYQISQFYHPIAQNGHIDILLEDDSIKTIRINRLHMEQDAGKSIHDQSPIYSYIDLNRAGIALMEIVTEPDLSSPFEAAEYIRKLRSILRYVGSCDGDMEKGSFRCDANVSVRKEGDPLGTRCEIKNLNSIRNIVRAIEYEAARQVELIENGEQVKQETRLFDANTGETRTMRSKENVHDYRYFPDPDLLPIVLEQVLIDEIRSSIPELPDMKIQRYAKDYNFDIHDAKIIVEDKLVAEFFEKAVKDSSENAKQIANWLIGDLFALLNKFSIELAECKITPLAIKELVELINDETISGKMAKEVFEHMFETGKAAHEIIKERGLVQLSDVNELTDIIMQILAGNPDSVEKYRQGADKLFGFFVGQVMKKTEGKANPKVVNGLLKEKLA